MAGFRRAHPGVSFELTLGHPSDLLPRIDDGRLDLAFTDVFEGGPRRPGPAGLEVVEVMEERLLLIASASYEAEHLHGGRGRRKLSEASFIAYQPRALAIRGWFRHHFDKEPARLEVALSVESVQAVIAAVGQGMGMGAVPAHTVGQAIGDGTLVTITTRRRAITNRVSLTRLLDKVPSRAERAFVHFLGQRPRAGRRPASAESDPPAR